MQARQTPVPPRDLEELDAEKILEWASFKFHPRIALASSFSAEDVIITDMIAAMNLKPKIFTIDTGRLPQETYDLVQTIMDRYDLDIEFYFPKTSEIQKMLASHGPNLFYSSPQERKLCCAVRKVEPLTRALSGLDAWITGLRREQAPTRAEVRKVEVDQTNGGIFKVNPLADWSEGQVWEYVRENDLPYNRLYDRGYASIGCAPCTRPSRPGLGPRSGRWWWEDPESRECGLHRR